MRAKVQSKKKPVGTNPKEPIRLWAPKYEIVYPTNMFQERRKTVIMVHGQWLVTTYDRRKSYVLNPNSEREGNYGIRRKPKMKDHRYGLYW